MPLEEISRRVLVERRSLLKRLRAAATDAETANTDPMVGPIIAQLREQADSLCTTVGIRLQCMSRECDTTDVVEVDVDDPQMTMPNAMLCAVHANPPEEDE